VKGYSPVMQFTGLKDKNGEDIYEGDIIKGYVHDAEKMFIVTFHADKYSCGFVGATDESCNPYINIWYEGLHVIGNIHEHKHLLDSK
jgi:uncharacterized phage protein (TIGR01671 family)